MADAPLTVSDLVDAEFLSSIDRLRIVANRVDPGGRFADQRSRESGSGIEFRDYRPYSSGDDLRAVDWNIYRRLGRVFVRLFEEMEDLPLYLLPDASRSMFVETPPRAIAAYRTALALASISVNHHDTVTLMPFAEGLQPVSRPSSGPGAVLRLARRLADVRPGNGSELSAAIDKIGHMRLRRGVLVVVSDFFDPAGIDDVVKTLRRVRHRLLLIQVTRTADREPDLSGDVRVRDCESGSAEDVSVTPHVMERYRAAYDRFESVIADVARSRSAGLLRLDADAPVVPQLVELFRSGSYVA